MSSRTRQSLLPLVGILLLAINLRPAITAVGPVITDVGHDLALTPAELGLLGALPVATFGIISGFIQILIGRFGVERVTLGSMLLLTGATVLRSWPGPEANLWVGTILVGAAIAMGNVAVPVIVKRAYPDRAAGITGIYTAVLGVFAGLAAALAVPISNLSTLGWRLSLGVWAMLTIVAAVYWAGQAISVSPIRGGTSVPLQETSTNLWRSPVAWQLSVYMGTQSAMFYVAITWLPSVEQHLGYSAVTAGWHMFILQIAGVGGNLLAPLVMRLGPDQRLATVLPAVFFLLAVAGFYWFPGLALLWVLVLGTGTGASFVVALSLMATRASNLRIAGQLSAMSQGVGYIIAGFILFVAGQVAGQAMLGVLAVLALTGAIVGMTGLLTGRKRMV